MAARLGRRCNESALPDPPHTLPRQIGPLSRSDGSWEWARAVARDDRPRVSGHPLEVHVTADTLSANAKVLAALREVARAAAIEVDDEALEAVAPTVVALLARPLNAASQELAETEPAFGLQIRPARDT